MSKEAMATGYVHSASYPI